MNRSSSRTAIVAAIALVSLGLLSLTGQAQPAAKATTFDFKDPKAVNGITFFMDSELEPIVGMATGISGQVSYDPAHPASTTGSIHIDATTLVCSNDAMTKVLHKADWINVKDHATITYEIEKVTSSRVNPNGTVTLTTSGHLLVAGVKLAKELTIIAHHVKDGAKARGGADSGDILVLRTQFEISRTDFGIKPDMGFDKVGAKIQINAAIAGYSK